MRIAAPGFIYALALLTLKNEKHPIHRKRLIKIVEKRIRPQSRL